MASLSGSFETDLSSVDALSACAEAIEGLGWEIDSIDGKRIVCHPSGDGPQPTIETAVRESQTGSDIEIRGTTWAGGSRDELVPDLDLARDAIRVSVEKASHTDTWKKVPAPAPADAPTDQESTERRPEPKRPIERRRPIVRRTETALTVIGLLLVAACLLLPIHLLWIAPVAIGVLLLIGRHWVVGGLVIVLGAGFWVVSHELIWKLYETPSGSMEPTLHVGDRFAVNRLIYDFTDPKIGDVVVFHAPAGAQRGNQCGVPRDPNEPCPKPTAQQSVFTLIKRIVAGPGDKISIRNGHPVVNGKIAKESFIRPCNGGSACNLPKPITVPPGDYFLMGDNRGSSADSRFWGPVPKDWFVGQVFFVYRPLDRISFP
jgi:signal peptidase I